MPTAVAQEGAVEPLVPEPVMDCTTSMLLFPSMHIAPTAYWCALAQAEGVAGSEICSGVLAPIIGRKPKSGRSKFHTMNPGPW
jgi:hypothetical protein